MDPTMGPLQRYPSIPNPLPLNDGYRANKGIIPAVACPLTGAFWTLRRCGW